jgi:CDP-2,3-bis-(O-geranylgeranyl)-sn-glycerol synthase
MTHVDVVRVLYFFGPAYAADVSPIIVARLLPRYDLAIDGGKMFRGRRLLGGHKTWRGLFAGVLAAVIVWEAQRSLYGLGIFRAFALVDYSAEPVVPGLLMGLGAGAGDAFKSLLKRQMSIAPGATWPVFDQLDFFLGAVALVSFVHVPPLDVVLAMLPIVFLADIAATTILCRLGLKDSWL